METKAMKIVNGLVTLDHLEETGFKEVLQHVPVSSFVCDRCCEQRKTTNMAS